MADVTKLEPRITQCQWLHGEPRDRNFCNRPTVPGSPWCAKHYTRVFVPAKKAKTQQELLS